VGPPHASLRRQDGSSSLHSRLLLSLSLGLSLSLHRQRHAQFTRERNSVPSPLSLPSRSRGRGGHEGHHCILSAAAHIAQHARWPPEALPTELANGGARATVAARIPPHAQWPSCLLIRRPPLRAMALVIEEAPTSSPAAVVGGNHTLPFTSPPCAARKPNPS
jgi:hypothetical protein